MKTSEYIQKLLLVMAMILCAPVSYAQSSDLQISGRITGADGAPAVGPVDIEIRFFSKATGGTQLGAMIAKPAVPLTQGIFKANLQLSEAERTTIFGAGSVWMEITDATNGRTFSRQSFSAVPYALRIPVDNKTLSFDSAGKLKVGSGAMTPGSVLAVDGSGNLTWGAPAAGGLDKSGDTMAGDLDMGTNTVTNVADPVNLQDAATKNYVDAVDASAVKKDGTMPLTGNWGLGGFDLTGVGNVRVGTDKSVGLGHVLTANEAAFTAGWDNDEKGYTWYNPDTNQVKFWNGSSIQALGVSGAGLTSLGGQSGGAQTFDSGIAGNAPSIDSAGDIHTLNVPMANAGASVTGGVISNAEYNTFNGKADDAAVLKHNGSVALSGALNAGTNKITNLGTPTVATDAATMGYVDTGLATKQNSLGFTAADDSTVLKHNGSVALSGALSAGTNKITNLGAPTVATDAATMGYVDTELATKQNSLGFTAADDSTVLKHNGSVALSGALSAGTNKITNLGAPTVATDASTMGYVDTTVGALSTAVSGKAADADVLKHNGSVALTSNWGIGGFDLSGAGNIRMNDEKTIGLGKINTADEAGITGGWTNIQEGYTWYDPDTDEVKYWDGSSVQALGISGGITTLGGQAGGTQTFGAGTAGNSPAINSAGNIHTLNVPMANAGVGVTGGVISNAEYNTFNGKADDAAVLKHNGSIALSGNLSAGTNKITNLGAPTVATDAATRGYVDTGLATKQNSLGFTAANDSAVLKHNGSVALSADWNAGAYKIKNLDDPADPGDAATKNYVDSIAETDPKMLTLSATEVNQLENINATTVSVAQWGYLGAMTAQPLQTESDPQVGANTTNFLSKWNGSALVTGTLYDNGNVGIGTTIPSELLDVSGGDVKIRANNRLHFSNTSDRVYLNSPSSDQFSIGTSGAEALRINAAGNVGIGTADPQDVLDLGSATTGRSITWSNSSSIGTWYSGGGLGLLMGLELGGANQVNYSYANSARAGIRVGGGAGVYGDISFFNAPSSVETVGNTFDHLANTRLIIKDTGNVGIGSTTPDDKLVITPTATVSGAGGILINRIGTGTGPGESWSVRVKAADNAGSLVLGQSSSDYLTGGLLPWAGNSNSFIHYPASAEFRIGTGAGSIPTMTMLANRNVGIGTTAPDEKLHVEGSIKMVDGNEGDGKVLTSDASGVASWQTVSTAGRLVDVVYYQRSDSPTGNTAMPTDNTIPQITEGTEFLSVTITPKKTTNILMIDVNGFGSAAGGLNITTALFRDSVSDALAATSVTPSGVNFRQPFTLTHHMTAGTTSPITFSVRIGENAGNTIRLNGDTGSQKYGGVAVSSIRVTEIDN